MSRFGSWRRRCGSAACRPGYSGRRRWESRCGSLPVDPVRQLYEKAVVGHQREQIAEVAAQAARARDTGGQLTPLTPYDEQRRAGPVLPAQHDVGVELFVVESFAERGVAIRYVAAPASRRPRDRAPLSADRL